MMSNTLIPLLEINDTLIKAQELKTSIFKFYIDYLRLSIDIFQLFSIHKAIVIDQNFTTSSICSYIFF